MKGLALRGIALWMMALPTSHQKDMRKHKFHDQNRWRSWKKCWNIEQKIRFNMIQRNQNLIKISIQCCYIFTYGGFGPSYKPSPWWSCFDHGRANGSSWGREALYWYVPEFFAFGKIHLSMSWSKLEVNRIPEKSRFWVSQKSHWHVNFLCWASPSWCQCQRHRY